MHWIMLDAETTGLLVKEKHRLVEIAAIEIDAKLLGEVFISMQIISTEH